MALIEDSNEFTFQRFEPFRISWTFPAPLSSSPVELLRSKNFRFGDFLKKITEISGNPPPAPDGYPFDQIDYEVGYDEIKKCLREIDRYWEACGYDGDAINAMGYGFVLGYLVADQNIQDLCYLGRDALRKQHKQSFEIRKRKDRIRLAKLKAYRVLLEEACKEKFKPYYQDLVAFLGRYGSSGFDTGIEGCNKIWTIMKAPTEPAPFGYREIFDSSNPNKPVSGPAFSGLKKALFKDDPQLEAKLKHLSGG